MENRQKIPVPRRSFLWSLNETSGEILTHIGPTEFTPSANDRIVRANNRGGYEPAPMEARPFVIARDGEYVLLENPVMVEPVDGGSNGGFIPGGNKEKELRLGTKKIIPGPCAFPLWPGQSAEVRPAHKLGANQYLLIEVVGAIDEAAPYFKLVIDSAKLSSVVIDAADGGPSSTAAPASPSGRQGRPRCASASASSSRAATPSSSSRPPASRSCPRSRTTAAAARTTASPPCPPPPSRSWRACSRRSATASRSASSASSRTSCATARTSAPASAP
jgi:hypothetical protein